MFGFVGGFCISNQEFTLATFAFPEELSANYFWQEINKSIAVKSTEMLSSNLVFFIIFSFMVKNKDVFGAANQSFSEYSLLNLNNVFHPPKYILADSYGGMIFKAAMRVFCT